MGERGFQNDNAVTKIYEQWQGPQSKEPKLTTEWRGTVGGGTDIQSKLAFSNINRNRRLGLSPCAGVATGLLKTPRTQVKIGKNDTVLIPVLSTFKIATFPHLEHRSNMTEYSFYDCAGYRNAKTSHAYAASCLQGCQLCCQCKNKI